MRFKRSAEYGGIELLLHLYPDTTPFIARQGSGPSPSAPNPLDTQKLGLTAFLRVKMA